MRFIVFCINRVIENCGKFTQVLIVDSMIRYDIFVLDKSHAIEYNEIPEVIERNQSRKMLETVLHTE